MCASPASPTLQCDGAVPAARSQRALPLKHAAGVFRRRLRFDLVCAVHRSTSFPALPVCPPPDSQTSNEPVLKSSPDTQTSYNGCS